MATAYFDCFSGIAGDMILGAFIDLGLDVDHFKKEIAKLSLTGYEIQCKRMRKKDYNAMDVNVIVKDKQPHRTYIDIKKLIETSDLTDRVKKISIDIFFNLAKAESKVHNVTIETVHFHEIGAVDSIIDIVGTAIALDFFDIQEVYCSSLPLGSGFVYCDHGKISIPAPATKELLVGIPTYTLDSGHEMVTPTGAAVVKTICSDFKEKPCFLNEKIGYGSGKIKSKQPGVLKISLGEI